MDKQVKLKEILSYYKEVYSPDEDMDSVYDELIANNVEVRDDSFYCEIHRDGSIILLAGTKTSADLWVLKKIIKLIRNGKEIHTMLNGNSDHLLKQLSRYNMRINKRISDMSFMTFNPKEGMQNGSV